LVAGQGQHGHTECQSADSTPLGSGETTHTDSAGKTIVKL